MPPKIFPLCSLKVITVVETILNFTFGQEEWDKIGIKIRNVELSDKKDEQKITRYLMMVQFQPGQTQESSHRIQLVAVRQTFSLFDENVMTESNAPSAAQSLPRVDLNSRIKC